MFAGSKHVPRGQFDKFIDAAGGTDSNGSTNFDRTNYFFTLPSHQLALGLWLKSDMLGYMLDEVDAVALANQQGRGAQRAPPDHREPPPMAWPTRRSTPRSSRKATPTTALPSSARTPTSSPSSCPTRDFARTYYRPNNATLVLAGDFDPPKPRPWSPPISARQGRPQTARGPGAAACHPERAAPGGHRPHRAAAPSRWPGTPRLCGGRRCRAGRRQPCARRRQGQPALRPPGARQAARAERAGRCRTRPRSARCSTSRSSRRPGAKLDDIEALVDAEIARLAAEPPTEAEVARPRGGRDQLLQRMEKVATLADLVNFTTRWLATPALRPRIPARYRSITPQQVSAGAARWLRRTRVSLHTVPGEKLLAADVPTPPPPGKAPKASASTTPPPGAPSHPAAAKPLALPAVRSFQLANGLTVLHSPAGPALVSASLVLRAGSRPTHRQAGSCQLHRRHADRSTTSHRPATGRGLGRAGRPAACRGRRRVRAST